MTLALKYRPSTLEDLVGQYAVKEILGALVRKARAGQIVIPASLLFEGPKGSGKTTCARILAAALNCHQTIGADPCGGCPGCALTVSGSMDVVEVDAASHGRVEDIRTLVDSAAYMTSGRHRIFILDECHSLSSAAWQALLKVLEEPPAKTSFVLVTTESQKVPDTIASRSLWLRFQPITVEHIVGRLEHIAGLENLHTTPGALTALARYADGALRDAVMALDQLSLLGDITEATFAQTFGAPDFGPALLDALALSDIPRALQIIEDYSRRSSDPVRLIDACIESLTDRLLTGDTKQILQAVKALWEIRASLRGGSSATRPALAAVLAALAPLLADLAPTLAPTPTAKPALSADDLKALFLARK